MLTTISKIITGDTFKKSGNIEATPIIKNCAKYNKEIFNNYDDVNIHDTDEALYIIIEGTDTLLNLAYNMFMTTNKHGIHSGYYKHAVECIHDYKLFDLMTSANVDKPIVLSGYSLGAASAMVVLHEFMKEHAALNKQIELVLFGCPRVGNRTFHDSFMSLCKDIPMVSFENGNDIVCRMPSVWIGYRNVVPTTPLKAKYDGIISSVFNHHIDRYVQNIKQLKKPNDD
jgi:hypothetical protein